MTGEVRLTGGTLIAAVILVLYVGCYLAYAGVVFLLNGYPVSGAIMWAASLLSFAPIFRACFRRIIAVIRPYRPPMNGNGHKMLTRGDN